jgi:flavin reductase (DIM6/NTAB) family NADH-FMN oxidoreductase RutF
MDEALKAKIAPALGKIASGLYIATARVDGAPVGMLCSFVEQASFEPPMITLAVAPERPISPALEDEGIFGLHVLAKGDHVLMKSFARGSTPDSFATHELIENEWKVPQFAEAWAFLVAKVRQQVRAGDHIVYVADVLHGALQKERQESMVRVRSNGFSY